MRIAIWHNLPSGGGKRALYYHVRGLVERGHDAVAWSLDTADTEYMPLSEFASEHVVLSETNGRPGSVRTKRIGREYYKSLDRLRAFDEACRTCAREIDAGDFDVLFANSAAHFYVPYVLRHVRLPKVLYLQEPCRFMYEAAPALPWMVTAPEDLTHADLFDLRPLLRDYPLLQTLRLQAKQEWLNARACDYLLVNSYYSRESVLRAYGVDAKVCYLGVDTSLFRDQGLPRERFVLGLGSFDSIKGVDLAIRAVALLPDPRPPLVWIANSGHPAYKAEMTELAKSLQVDLRLREKVTDEELVSTLNTASVLLYTSRLEPFGFAPLEANACGLPVVGVAEGGVRETVRDGVNGLLVESDPAPLAVALSRLLEDAELARRLGQNGVEYVKQHWNVDQSVNRLESYLVKAAKHHRE